MGLSACLAVPRRPAYPYDAIVAGLDALGIRQRPDDTADVLVTWSPWAGTPRKTMAESFNRQGKPVVVMENGWLPRIGGESYYQAALGGWNGTGDYRPGGPERWPSWQVPMRPWQDGDHVVVVGQHGSKLDRMSSTPDWHQAVSIEWPAPVIRRDKHEDRPLEHDLEGAHACVVWTSTKACIALLMGVPVIRLGPTLICAEACGTRLSQLATPPKPNRLSMFEQIAWAQWSEQEIAAGTPFERLLWT